MPVLCVLGEFLSFWGYSFVFLYMIQAYTSQFVALVMFALMMSEDKLSLQPRRREIINGLRALTGQPLKHHKHFTWVFFWLIQYCVYLIDLIKKVLSLDDKIKAIANELYQQKSLLVMGRGFHYSTCLEGALVRSIQKSHVTLDTGNEMPGALCHGLI